MAHLHGSILRLALVIMLSTMVYTSMLEKPWPKDEMPLREPDASDELHSHIHVVTKRDALPPTQFHFIYVLMGGTISNTSSGSGTSIKIAATLDVQYPVLAWAANIISRMTRNIPPSIFSQLCAVTSVGIFKITQTITVFPEYAYLAPPPQCQNNCTGTCSQYCTADGRSFSALAGVGGTRAVALLDNLMCSLDDPYFGTLSGLVHEYGHTVQQYGISANWTTAIKTAYANARANNTWDRTSYAMSTFYEYWACATSAYFFADSTPGVISGGLNSCGTSGLCPSEKSARAWLKQQDPALFAILSYVYNNNRNPSLFIGGITICPPLNYYYDVYF